MSWRRNLDQNLDPIDHLAEKDNTRAVLVKDLAKVEIYRNRTIRSITHHIIIGKHSRHVARREATKESMAV